MVRHSIRRYSRLRIPIRGYEAAILAIAAYASMVTNPYKGL